MSIKNQLGELLETKMNRKEFLKYLAVGIAAISGADAALKVLAPKPQDKVAVFSNNYGSAAYGGKDTAAKFD